jgi:hypothetical protein
MNLLGVALIVLFLLLVGTLSTAEDILWTTLTLGGVCVIVFILTALVGG